MTQRLTACSAFVVEIPPCFRNALRIKNTRVEVNYICTVYQLKVKLVRQYLIINNIILCETCNIPITICKKN